MAKYFYHVLLNVDGVDGDDGGRQLMQMQLLLQLLLAMMQMKMRMLAACPVKMNHGNRGRHPIHLYLFQVTKKEKQMTQ